MKYWTENAFSRIELTGTIIGSFFAAKDYLLYMFLCILIFFILSQALNHYYGDKK